MHLSIFSAGNDFDIEALCLLSDPVSYDIVYTCTRGDPELRRLFL